MRVRIELINIKVFTLQVNGESKRFCLPKELKATKTLGVVMGAFLACWFPFFLLNILYALDRTIQIDPEAILIAKWLHYLNSVLNPIIYSCMNRDFRTAFKRLAYSCFDRLAGRSDQLDRNLGTTRGQSLSVTNGKVSSLKQKSIRNDAV